ncbi:uncharacterized protein BDR25DRAFT_283070 [Lindgomyces ingoldianus]|uniref:Uncharacterized protein n=1 Tax=Lindgomyces ingoldianus TaxID=673940 RepID=A0ACB6R3U1_9PLEO|nr:uncharacterized protein BDR25DRAFT_283070 [Lindgomyces ingoldianus]KAF2473498.1 hypothetical protein BDR25DRAFT_283070 [Lindgomyces ingoldianus]
MATVTIGKSYFDALLRRAEFHTSGSEFLTTPNLSNNVTISKAEHEYLLQAVREYHLLKNALFRGGLTAETLETLLSGENGMSEDPAAYSNTCEEAFRRPKPVAVTMTGTRSSDASPDSENTAVADGLQPRTHSNSYNRVYSFGQPDSSIDTPDKDDDFQSLVNHRVPTHDQRTVLITNLSDRTTHKDLTNIIRGGRLLDIFLRNDRSATVSFVEGAQDFLTYAKKNDIYLHTKRLEFRWNDRQFHVPSHVSNKIANGATRNLVVRGAAGKHTATQIRDHLDHIHNLVVVDISFRNGDAFISTNSIHNALFARTCMMSRTIYKGLRIDWYPDECAAPLPKPSLRVHTPAQAPSRPAPVTNRYTLLDFEGNDLDSDEEDESYLSNGVPVNNWADATAA